MNPIVLAWLALLAVSLGTGVRLAVAGVPYGTATQTVHKLASVAFAVPAAIILFGGGQGPGLTAVEIALLAAAAAAFAALLLTGAILSATQRPTATLRVIHTVTAGSLTLCAGWKLILLLIG